MHRIKSWVLSIFIVLSTLLLASCTMPSQPNTHQDSHSELSPTHLLSEEATILDEDGYYYELQEVADYIYQYGHLPNNYITKAEASQMNWDTSQREYVIGGDKFGNREGLLPEEEGRQYYEADIQAGYTHHRGPERIVYSNDRLIFYTPDHYESFEQLY